MKTLRMIRRHHLARISALMMSIAVGEAATGCSEDSCADTATCGDYEKPMVDGGVGSKDSSVETGDAREGATRCLPGEKTNLEPCGKCGALEKMCEQDGTWSTPQCVDEGACAAGQEQAEACGNGGTRKRVCNASCAWEPYDECTAKPPCSGGQVETESCVNSGKRTRACNASNDWGPWGECTGEEAGVNHLYYSADTYANRGSRYTQIQLNDRNQSVKEFQVKICRTEELKREYPSINANCSNRANEFMDGNFGPMTLAAAKDIQSYQKVQEGCDGNPQTFIHHSAISANGIVGPQTWGKLEVMFDAMCSN